MQYLLKKKFKPSTTARMHFQRLSKKEELSEYEGALLKEFKILDNMNFQTIPNSMRFVSIGGVNCDRFYNLEKAGFNFFSREYRYQVTIPLLNEYLKDVFFLEDSQVVEIEDRLAEALILPPIDLSFNNIVTRKGLPFLFTEVLKDIISSDSFSTGRSREEIISNAVFQSIYTKHMERVEEPFSVILEFLAELKEILGSQVILNSTSLFSIIIGSDIDLDSEVWKPLSERGFLVRRVS